MPIYDYLCEENNQTIEVLQRMNDTIKTWGELCDKAGIEPGDTPIDSPVARVITAPNLCINGELPRFDESILPK